MRLVTRTEHQRPSGARLVLELVYCSVAAVAAEQRANGCDAFLGPSGAGLSGQAESSRRGLGGPLDLVRLEQGLGKPCEVQSRFPPGIVAVAGGRALQDGNGAERSAELGPDASRHDLYLVLVEPIDPLGIIVGSAMLILGLDGRQGPLRAGALARPG
jgi:hypothetical protein